MKAGERYPVNVRYSRELRNDIEKLKRVLVPVMNQPSASGGQSRQVGSMGAVQPVSMKTLQIPLGELVDIKIVKGPTQIKSEEGLLTAYVYIDFTGRDIGGYVNEAKQKVASMKIPRRLPP